MFTVNPANDQNLVDDPGAYYVSMFNVRTKQHATAVYRSDGTLADVKSNKQWVDARRAKAGVNIGALLRDSFRRAINMYRR